MKILLLLVSLSAFAAYTEKEIEPHIGPYKLEQGKTKNCPKEISVFAHCTLGVLSLNHPDNPDFVFEEFTSLNKGKKVTKEGKRIIEEFEANYDNKVINSKKTIYLPNGGSYQEKGLLKFQKDTMLYSLVYQDEKKTREISHCLYKKDHAKLKKQLEDFCRQYPDGYDCKK